MGRFRHTVTEVVVSVDDSKDGRYEADPVWESAELSAKKTTARKTSSSKSEK